MRAPIHRPVMSLLKPIPTHHVIPAQAGIQVRNAPHTSSLRMTFSMDSGLRRNDTVIV